MVGYFIYLDDKTGRFVSMHIFVLKKVHFNIWKRSFEPLGLRMFYLSWSRGCFG